MLTVACALMSPPHPLGGRALGGAGPHPGEPDDRQDPGLKERRQLTVLMAEQNFNQATKIADRGCIPVHGKIEEGRRTRELRENELVFRGHVGSTRAEKRQGHPPVW
jgi:branched-chain amino acid transport system ATP-binding protein